jgi:hypothetical protein
MMDMVEETREQKVSIRQTFIETAERSQWKRLKYIFARRKTPGFNIVFGFTTT